MVRTAALAALAVGAAVVLYWSFGGIESGHRFSAVVPEADNFLPGAAIDAGGKKVGHVSSIKPVDGGRMARITMRITDDAYWPLPRDSRLEGRLGGTVSFSSRYFLLTRGKDTSHTIGADGVLPQANVVLPVETDQFIRTFNSKMRVGVKGFLSNAGPALAQARPQLRRALPAAVPVVKRASHVFQDVVSDRAALETLVHSTGRTVNAIDRSSPGFGVLLDGAAQTFDAIADQAGDLQTTLDRFPAALRQTRTTLTRADVTLRDAGDLTDRIGPGIRELQRTATPVSSLVGNLHGTMPDLKGVARVLPHQAVVTGDLLYQASTLARRRLKTMVPKLNFSIGCLRPYAPEIVLFGTTWGDWMSGVDHKDHVLRATVQNFLPAAFNSIPYTTTDAKKLFPGLEYGFPRPPGELAGQPWFQPQCGVGPDSIDLTKDKESARFAANRAASLSLGGKGR